jgi:hypothetical protein
LPLAAYDPGMTRRSMVIVASALLMVGVACSGDRASREVIVSPGTTILDADDDVLPGDVIICRQVNGESGVTVPDPGNGASISSGLDVEVDLDGRIVARCTRRMAQA